MTNLQEYLAGTDPLDPFSSLRLHAQFGPGTGRAIFSFRAVAGKNYSIQYTDDLAAGVWNKLSDVLPNPDTHVVTFDDPGSSNTPSRFYRVVTPTLP
jgi:hypothetical protein